MSEKDETWELNQGLNKPKQLLLPYELLTMFCQTEQINVYK
jgi:hypothetical protein